MSFILAAAVLIFALAIVYISAATEPWRYARPFRVKVAVLGVLLAAAIASTHWIGW